MHRLIVNRQSGSGSQVNTRNVIAGASVAIVAGISVAFSPPVFVAGTLPTNVPDGGCRVVKTGPMQGQNVCDLAAWGKPKSAFGLDWNCIKPTDGGCDVYEQIRSDAGPVVTK